MVDIEKLTPNQIKLMRLLLKLNKETCRKEVIEELNIHPTSLQFAIKPLEYYFINVKKIGNKDLLSLNEAGEMAIKAFNLANTYIK